MIENVLREHGWKFHIVAATDIIHARKFVVLNGQKVKLGDICINKDLPVESLLEIKKQQEKFKTDFSNIFCSEINNLITELERINYEKK